MKKHNACILLTIILASLIFSPFDIFSSFYNVKAFGLTSSRTTITPPITNPTLGSTSLHQLVSSPKISTNTNTNTNTNTHTIRLNPTSGYVGIVVQVNGSGFTQPLAVMVMKSSNQVLIMYDGKQVSATNPSSSGTFTTTFTVPPSAGTNNVTAAYGGISTSATFTVLQQSTRIAVTKPLPTMTLAPNTGTVGNSTTVTGTNFAPSSAILITYAGNPITNTTSDAKGSFSTTFMIPSSVGTNNVTATDASRNSASATFTVIPPSTTQTTTAKNTTTNTSTPTTQNVTTTQSQSNPQSAPNSTIQSTPQSVFQPSTPPPSPVLPSSPQVTPPTPTPASSNSSTQTPSTTPTQTPTATTSTNQSTTSPTTTPPTPSISVQTDKYSYLPKDTIYVSGIVTGFPSGDFVQLQFYDSSGILKNSTLVAPDSIDGRFFVSYTIPNDMTSGTGKVVASLADSKLISSSAGVSATNSAFYTVSSNSNPWIPVIVVLGAIGAIGTTIFFKSYRPHSNGGMSKSVTESQPKSGDPKDGIFSKVPDIEIEIRAGIENE